MGKHEKGFRFGESYSELVQLSDGSRAKLRLIQPSDKALMQEGFDRLSPQSRHDRFMGHKSELTEHELRYYTEVDGIDHFAMCALQTRLVSRDIGLGTGRFVRLADSPNTAEPAVTILDEYQGKGLGTILLERLLGAAWEREIRWFHFELLADNLAMKRLIQTVSHEEVKFTNDGGGCVVAVFPIPEPERMSIEPGLLKRSPLFRAFAQIARSDVRMRARNTSPPPPPE